MPLSVLKLALLATAVLSVSLSVIPSQAKPLALQNPSGSTADVSPVFARTLQLDKNASTALPRSPASRASPPLVDISPRANPQANFERYERESADILRGLNALASEYGSGKGDKTEMRARGNALALDYFALNQKVTGALQPGTKGIKYYNKDVPFETLLKNIVNYNKDTLTALVKIVYCDPSFGATLAPILYDVKCIIDELLNITENITDLVLNGVFLNDLGFCRDAILGLCTLGYLGLGSCSGLLASGGLAGLGGIGLGGLGLGGL